MEENSNLKPNPEEPKNALLKALEDIISGNNEIKGQLGKFSQNQEQILLRFSEKEKQLNKESAAVENLSKSISTELEKKNQENQDKTQKIFDTELGKFQKVELKLTEKDKSLLSKVESIFRNYWKLPIIIAGISLLTAGLTGFLAVRFFSESVKSKGELREEMINNWNSQNKRLVDDDEWNALINERIIIQNFVKDNDNAGKALINYRKGMVKSNQGKAIYKSIDSDKVVKE